MNAQLKNTENQSSPQELPFHKLLELEFSTPILSNESNCFQSIFIASTPKINTFSEKMFPQFHIFEIFHPPIVV